MIHSRARDRGHFGGHPRPEFMIVIAIIGIVAAIAIPNLVKVLGARRAKCLDHLAAYTSAPLPADTVCPGSKKPYAIAKREGTEEIACAEPAGHLDSNPRFVRSGSGPWQLLQTLPPYAGGEVVVTDGNLEVRQSPGRVSLHVTPGAFTRYFFAPLMFLILFGFTLACVVAVVIGLWRRLWWELFFPLLGAGVLGLFSYVSLVSFARSHEWILERNGPRVTRVDYVFGQRWSEQVLEGCLGVVPVTEMSRQPRVLRLVHAPDALGRRTTPLESIPTDRLDLASWVNRALLGP